MIVSLFPSSKRVSVPQLGRTDCRPATFAFLGTDGGNRSVGRPREADNGSRQAGQVRLNGYCTVDRQAGKGWPSAGREGEV